MADNKPHQSKIYSEFSHLYDKIFERVFFPRILRVIDSLRIPRGARVLELGVGTGLSLCAYPPHADVTGIDLAQDMLDQAGDKIAENGWNHITLRQMDALELDYPDDCFDFVMAFHVVSVVPNANQLMDEARRVCRPGGKLVIINHFRSPRRWLRSLVDLVDPVTRHLGWRTTLGIDELLNDTAVEIEQQYKTNPRSLFTVLVARNEKELAAVG